MNLPKETIDFLKSNKKIDCKFNEPGQSNYISNADRKDMIKSLRETADRLDNKEDFKTPKDNIYGT